MRWVAAVLLCAAVALGAGAPRKVTIKKRSGEIVKGTVLSEMETGYLLKLDATGKTAAVKYDEIADFAESSAPPTAVSPAPPGQPPPQPPPLSPPPMPPPATSLPPPPPTPPAAIGPCTANESYIVFGDRDEVMGAICAGRTEVSVADYQSCVMARQCSADELRCGRAANWGRPERMSHPINCVSARQAETYCAWRQARLPSLLEFVAMASPPGDREGEFPWGDDDPNDRACWSGDQNRTGTCPVGSYPRGMGRSGILDMAGNVWEWTATEKRGSRIFMGGGWQETRNNRLERATENRNSSDTHSDDVGFRCVRAVR